MKKLKNSGCRAALLLLAGVLALAGCKNPSSGGPTSDPEPGAEIESFEPVFDGITSSEFSIMSSSAAVVSKSPVDTGQNPEYGVSTSTTAPSSWQRGLTFTQGIQPNTTYYVFARAAARTADTVSYAAGPAVRGTLTVKTLASGEVTSVNTSWDPSPQYNDSGSGFRISAASPAAPYASSHPIEYTLNTSNDSSSLTSTTSWQETYSFSMNRVTSSSQYYLWARAKAANNDPAGVPFAKALELPGAKLSGTFIAQPGAATNNSAVVTVNGTENLTKTPDNAQVIEFGLGTSATVAPSDSSAWGLPNSSGAVTISSLAANTDYHLWARTRAITNYRAGEASKYDSSNNTPFLRTSGSTGSTGDLFTRLNTMDPGCVSTAPGNTVVLMRSVNLSVPIDIPDGVTLVVPAGITFDNQGAVVSGGGSIDVLGTIFCSTNLFVAVDVNSGAKFDNGWVTIGPTGTPPPAVVLTLTSGAITVKHGADGYDYTLNGKAKVNGGPSFRLGTQDKITIRESAELNASTDGSLDANGRIEIGNGGLLNLPGNNTLDVLKNTTSAQIVVNPGAMVQNNGTDIFRTANTVANAGVFSLESGSQVVISALTVAATSVTGVYRFLLSGGRISMVSNPSANSVVKPATIEVASNAALTIPATVTDAAVEAPLIVNGTLNNYGKLTINASGILDVRSNNVSVFSGADLKLTTGSTLRGGGTITVQGTIETPDAELKELSKSIPLTGKVDIREGGALRTTSPAKFYIGYTTTTDPGFELSGAGSPRFEISTVNDGGYYPQFTLLGSTGATATIKADTSLYGQLVISSGTTLMLASNKKLTLETPILALRNSGTINAETNATSANITATNPGTTVAGTPPLGFVKVSRSNITMASGTTGWTFTDS